MTIGFLTLACILDVYLTLTVRIAVDQQDLTMVSPISFLFPLPSDPATICSGTTHSGCYAIPSSLSSPSSHTSPYLPLSRLHPSPWRRKRTSFFRRFTGGYSY